MSYSIDDLKNLVDSDDFKTFYQNFLISLTFNPMTYPDIIPYDQWINSQLSVAQFYWWIQIENKTYIVDYIFCDDLPDWLCKPNLVEEKTYENMMNTYPEKVKEYYDKLRTQDRKPIHDTTDEIPF